LSAQRVAKLEGADEGILSQVRQSLPLMPDLGELVTTLHKFGWKSAIASGGFTYFSDHLQQMLGLDQTKADILLQLAEQYQIEVHNTIAVGDGANDLTMMGVAGLGIAYHAKPKVEQQAQSAVRYSGLVSSRRINTSSVISIYSL